MQQVSEEGRRAGVGAGIGPRIGGSGGERDLSLSGAGAAITALYAAKIEATRRGNMTASDRAVAIRALHDERSQALLALAWRRQAQAVAMREQRAAERSSDKVARRHTARLLNFQGGYD